MLRHLDLFSGIGGFALAAQMVGDIQTTQFVEIDPYCQRVLAKNFPGVPIHDDIRTFTASPGDFDLITFGSPCQDFSCANPNGRGLEGERSGLFFEAIRLVRLVRPRYAVFENVANILVKDGGLQFQQVLRAFYESGFDAEWQVISAASVGAPHLRERVFIVAANRECRGYDGGRFSKTGSYGNQPNSKAQRTPCSAKAQGLSKTIANSNSSRLEVRICDTGRQAEIGAAQRSGVSHGWSDQWSVEPGVLRVAHGVPDRMDRIRGLGNAVVPQVAAIPLRRVLQLAGGAA